MAATRRRFALAISDREQTSELLKIHHEGLAPQARAEFHGIPLIHGSDNRRTPMIG